MGRGENREEVVLPCANGSLRSVGVMVEGRNALIFDRGLGGLEEGSEISGGFIVKANVSERMRREEKNLATER